MQKTVAIVGLGLIGGSYAKALARHPHYKIIGIDKDPEIIRMAISDKAISQGGDASSLPLADIVLLALYPQATIDYIKENGDKFKKGAIVCDLCGVKSAVCEEIIPFSKEKGFAFIGAHPMAGKEVSGYQNSEATLFQNSSFIITPQDAPHEAIDTLTKLAFDAGFCQVVQTTPHDHDKRIAFTSQLPHAIACAYVKSPRSRQYKGFSAGSFKDVSRVALINEKLWSELFLMNSNKLSDEIDLLIKHLSEIRDAMDRGDKESLEKLLADSRKIMEEL